MMTIHLLTRDKQKDYCDLHFYAEDILYITEARELLEKGEVSISYKMKLKTDPGMTWTLNVYEYDKLLEYIACDDECIIYDEPETKSVLIQEPTDTQKSSLL